jgi:hypothetical protein
MSQELTATSIVALFDTNKAQRASFKDSLITSMKEGFVNPLDIHLQIKCMQDLVKQITEDKEYTSLVLEAAEKYPGKSFEYKQAKIEKKEVGVKYDYSVCADPIYARYAEAKSRAEILTKEREKFLQNVPEGGFTMVDEDGGETVTIHRPVKTSTTSIAVTLK